MSPGSPSATTTVPAGTAVVTEGERGDTFYVVVDGSLEVSADETPLRVLNPGDFFGEIALLRDVPRTATVTATSDSTVLAVRRMDFLSAVLGNPESAETVEEIVSSHIGASLVMQS